MLYRARLGWLLGHRFLLLTHRGRHTGLVHHAVLEVVRYDPATHECVVVSAWGERADWYLNLRASQALEVRIGRHRYCPTQRFLTADETRAELLEYQRRHPWAAAVIARLFGWSPDSSEATRRSIARSLCMVVFRPEEDGAR